jgi:hypothetical protein
MLTVPVTVKKIGVVRKELKEEGEVIGIERIGTLTVEFNADGIDVQALVDSIQDEKIVLGLADRQTAFDMGQELKEGS